jgi:hypothetical protein
MLRTMIFAAALALLVLPSTLRAQQVAPFCQGDGTQVPACPCANLGTTGRGCQNSGGTGGALLAATGATSPDTIVFTCSGELPHALSIVLQSDSRRGSIAFGDGIQCLTGTLRALYVKQAGNGTVVAPDAGDPSITQRSANLGDTIPSGAFRYYHVQYRDPSPSFCSAPQGSTWNVSNSMLIHW